MGKTNREWAGKNKRRRKNEKPEKIGTVRGIIYEGTIITVIVVFSL